MSPACIWCSLCVSEFYFNFHRFKKKKMLNISKKYTVFLECSPMIKNTFLVLKSCHPYPHHLCAEAPKAELQMLLFPNALCCSLYEHNCVCAVTKIVTKFLPAKMFCQLLRVTRKRSCTSAGNVQSQLHFRDDQQRAFGISNISNWLAHC